MVVGSVDDVQPLLGWYLLSLCLSLFPCVCACLGVFLCTSLSLVCMCGTNLEHQCVVGSVDDVRPLLHRYVLQARVDRVVVLQTPRQLRAAQPGGPSHRSYPTPGGPRHPPDTRHSPQPVKKQHYSCQSTPCKNFVLHVVVVVGAVGSVDLSPGVPTTRLALDTHLNLRQNTVSSCKFRAFVVVVVIIVGFFLGETLFT